MISPFASAGAVDAELEAIIGAVYAELDAFIDAVYAELEAIIGALDAELEAIIGACENLREGLPQDLLVSHVDREGEVDDAVSVSAELEVIIGAVYAELEAIIGAACATRLAFPVLHLVELLPVISPFASARASGYLHLWSSAGASWSSA